MDLRGLYFRTASWASSETADRSAAGPDLAVGRMLEVTAAPPIVGTPNAATPLAADAGLR
jgi:hypothetical protein